eukprot:scaffold95260_cov63-Phaeocystis_antarctica.AAC.2
MHARLSAAGEGTRPSFGTSSSAAGGAVPRPPPPRRPLPTRAACHRTTRAAALAASLSAFRAFSASRTSLVAAPRSGCCSRSLASIGLKPRSGSATRRSRTASRSASDIDDESPSSVPTRDQSEPAKLARGRKAAVARR